MNTWEDVNAHKAITGKNKKKLVFAGLWTSVCIVGPVLSAIDEGYDVYVITDASGDISKEAHDQSITRMVQAGAHPITSVQYVLELQRDWARKETYKPVNDLMKKIWWSLRYWNSVCSGNVKTLMGLFRQAESLPKPSNFKY